MTTSMPKSKRRRERRLKKTPLRWQTPQEVLLLPKERLIPRKTPKVAREPQKVELQLTIRMLHSQLPLIIRRLNQTRTT